MWGPISGLLWHCSVVPTNITRFNSALITMNILCCKSSVVVFLRDYPGRSLPFPCLYRFSKWLIISQKPSEAVCLFLVWIAFEFIDERGRTDVCMVVRRPTQSVRLPLLSTLSGTFYGLLCSSPAIFVGVLPWYLIFYAILNAVTFIVFCLFVERTAVNCFILTCPATL